MRLKAFLLLALASLVRSKYWLEEIEHRGTAPYYPDSQYRVFRNVKDFGAVGDGLTDDTNAINAAISAGTRCIPGICRGSTISPAIIYIPSGTYLISDSIINLYYTQIIGDPTNRPVIKASGSFSNKSFGLIDSNPYLSSGSLSYNSTNVFYRQIRNLALDTTALPPEFPAIGIHWPSSQATSITNCEFRLSTVPGNRHTGLFIEEGSGGLLNDLYFHGGGNATVLGNQQFTARNLWFVGADVAIWMPWDWGWTFKSVVFKNCRVGIKMDPASYSVGSITMLDSSFENIDIAISTTRNRSQAISGAASLAFENVKFQNVKSVLLDPKGVDYARSALEPGQSSIFVMGRYANSKGNLDAGAFCPVSLPRSGSLLDRGIYYERSKPQYEDVPSKFFISAKANGAYGDASHDDTQALNNLFKYTAENNLIAYLDAGYYVVTDTVYIPPNSKIVGEALASIIMGTGQTFGDINKPRPIVQVGRPGDVGQIEWSDTIISTRGAAAAGAVLIEYNLYSPEAPSGMWDVHTRIGGFAGTYLQVPECPAIKGANVVDPRCLAAYMSFHVTTYAGGLFTENCWFWVADHDLENQNYARVALFAGRGVLIEFQRGRIWLSATGSEHHVLYQYQFANTRDVYIGHAQTEQAYFQPIHLAQYPFPPVPALHDPDFEKDCQGDTDARCNMGWAMRIIDSINIATYGAGLYSFFINYNDTCASNKSPLFCQEKILSIRRSPGLKFLGLSTVGARTMVERDGANLVQAVDNNSTFADTLALYVS
ncbi:Glucan 1,3-beta-glucosidase [Fusarium venenatum]|uniref:Rhamnogalacturonase A/B/Epimerase-like pectate lyase domain-containing protein n=1 Tax=Fusarium venenatum TaxID=56646 RepID=A0A2L2T354_9HYPO|nr:uncharacterized protein FVRRES_13304 [Fusarium venenatum]KAG8360763.1 Glucan 1,3-beta-glucosidase [Fusarium venenatum]CEI40849.1 unnamed protein product [Fusarium venenatum]